MRSPVACLPAELLSRILKLLNVKQRVKCRLVCREWADQLCKPGVQGFWEKICLPVVRLDCKKLIEDFYENCVGGNDEEEYQPLKRSRQFAMRCIIEPVSRFLASTAHSGSLSSIVLDVCGKRQYI